MRKIPFASHGQQPERRGGVWPRSKAYLGQYGRMFRYLPPLQKTPRFDRLLERLQDAQRDAVDRQESGIPAGYTYFGQFVAHDITFNPMTDLTRRRDPESIVSFRTACLDLDSLYGRGPQDSPYLYERPNRGARAGKFPIGWGLGRGEEDLPRTIDEHDIALISDPRNDENTITSQLHLAFMKLHNRFFDETRGSFDLAQQLTCWHYQWVILHDYLPLICDDDVLKEIWPERESGKGWKLNWYKPIHSSFIPLEFAGAAFRFGHSMVRNGYRLNFKHRDPLPVFGGGSLGNLQGFRRLPPTWTVQWDHFLEFERNIPTGATMPQQSGLVDLALAPSLAKLPPEIVGAAGEDQGDARSILVKRNIDRGFQFELPSGQAVAGAIGEKDPLTPLIGEDEDPLWVYVLREAKERKQGKKLGKVGSTIVAETIIGLIANDRLSYLNVKPDWRPTSPGKEFKLSDLIVEAGMPIHRESLEKKGGFKDEYDPRVAALDAFKAGAAEVRTEMREARPKRSANQSQNARGLLALRSTSGRHEPSARGTTKRSRKVIATA